MVKKIKLEANMPIKNVLSFLFLYWGKIILNIKTPKTKKRIVLNHLSKTAVLVPPKYWCGVKFINKNSILMVVCDKYYDFNDYLRTFDEYKKYLKKL